MKIKNNLLKEGGWFLIFLKTLSFFVFTYIDTVIIKENEAWIAFSSIFIMFISASLIGIFFYIYLKRTELEKIRKIEARWKRFFSSSFLFFTAPALFAIYKKDNRYVIYLFLLANFVSTLFVFGAISKILELIKNLPQLFL